MTPEYPARIRRHLDKVDRSLGSLDFGPAYVLMTDERGTAHAFVDCLHCGATVRAQERQPFDHWATHHRARAAFIRFAEQRQHRGVALDVSMAALQRLLFKPTEPREDHQ